MVVKFVYVHGNVSDKYKSVEGAKNIYAETTIAMKDVLLNEIGEDTIVIMAAAPADFKPKQPAENKIKKETSNDLVIELEKNPDLLMALSSHLKENNITSSVLIGFAAETEKLEEYALGKLERKGLKYIVGNYVGKSNGFGEVESSIRIFSKSGLVHEMSNQPKEILAKGIVEFLIQN